MALIPTSSIELLSPLRLSTTTVTAMVNWLSRKNIRDESPALANVSFGTPAWGLWNYTLPEP